MNWLANLKIVYKLGFWFYWRCSSPVQAGPGIAGGGRTIPGIKQRLMVY